MDLAKRHTAEPQGAAEGSRQRGQGVVVWASLSVPGVGGDSFQSTLGGKGRGADFCSRGD